MNKRTFLFSLLNSFVASFLLGLSTLSLSFGTQSKISYVKQDIINCVQSTKETVQFSIFKTGKRIETLLENDVRLSLRSHFYSYALGTRYFDNNMYLSITSNDVTAEQDVNMLESMERPQDNSNYILHGDLPVSYSIATKQDGYTTYYGFLSSESNSIYISEKYADSLLTAFSLTSYKDLVFSEDNNTPPLLNVMLKNNLDDDFAFECRIRGVYKNDTNTARNLSMVGNKNNPLVICSPGVFDEITFNENKLLCSIKYNRTFNDTYQRFFNILESEFSDSSIQLDFNCNKNENISNNINNKLNSKGFVFFNKNSWLFVSVFIILSLGSLAISIVLTRKTKMNKYCAISFLAVFFTLFVAILSNIPGLVLLTTKSLFFVIPFLIADFVIYFVLIKDIRINKFISSECIEIVI